MSKKLTRTEEVTKMMQRKTGCTIEQICDKTGMLAHSARAFVSRMDVTIKKTKIGDKPMVYRILAAGEEAAA